MSFADHQDFLPPKEDLEKLDKELTKLEKQVDFKVLKEKELNKRIREIKERVRGESSRKISTYELGNYFIQELEALERYLRGMI